MINILYLEWFVKLNKIINQGISRNMLFLDKLSCAQLYHLTLCFDIADNRSCRHHYK